MKSDQAQRFLFKIIQNQSKISLTDGEGYDISSPSLLLASFVNTWDDEELILYFTEAYKDFNHQIVGTEKTYNELIIRLNKLGLSIPENYKISHEFHNKINKQQFDNWDKINVTNE